MTSVGYSGKRAAEIVGITYRQLDYWARTDLIRPSLTDASGSGSRRQYTYKDLLELKAVKNLLDAGIRLESVRDVFSYLRESLGEDVTAVNLVISGSKSVVVKTGEDLLDLLQNGQGVLNILPLAGVKDEVDAAIIDLYPDGAGGADPAGCRGVTMAVAQRPRFAHEVEEEFAALLDSYGIAWEYEPRTFVLERDIEGNPSLAVTPDFYLPDYDVYLELTTLRQKLVTKKNRKIRLLRQKYPEVQVKLLYQRDCARLLPVYGRAARR